ncbi:unnamed protein product [Rotaria magnacalcarata]
MAFTRRLSAQARYQAELMMLYVQASIVLVFFTFESPTEYRSVFRSVYCCRHPSHSMAEDQASSNEIYEGGEEKQMSYDDDSTTIAAVEEIKTTVADDYVEEPIEDYIVNLAVNEQPEGVSVSPSFVDTVITDMQGDLVPSKTTAMIDAINDYSSTILDELSTETTAITGGKRWWEDVNFLGKKFKKTKKSPAGTTTTKAVVSKGVSPDPKYQPVPNV